MERSYRIIVTLPKDVAEAIRFAAKRNGMSVSAEANRLLEIAIPYALAQKI